MEKTITAESIAKNIIEHGKELGKINVSRDMLDKVICDGDYTVAADAIGDRVRALGQAVSWQVANDKGDFEFKLTMDSPIATVQNDPKEIDANKFAAMSQDGIGKFVEHEVMEIVTKHDLSTEASRAILRLCLRLTAEPWFANATTLQLIDELHRRCEPTIGNYAPRFHTLKSA